MYRWAICIGFFVAFNLSAAPYDESIRKATRYLHNRRLNYKEATVVTVDFLARNYAIPIDTTEARKQLLSRAPRKLRYLLRTIDSTKQVSELEIRVLRKYSGILPTAIYCDVYPLPWDFLVKVREYGSEKGGWLTVWAVLALAISEWHGCVSDVQQLNEIRGVLVHKILEDLPKERQLTLLRIEFLLSLYLAGRADSVPPQQLKTLVAGQLSDGSWEHDDEMTAKALWVMILARDGHNPSKRLEVIRHSRS